MYLQLEQHILLPKGKILGIFDLDHTSWEKKTKEFLRRAEEEGRVFWVSSDLPRSFVLVGEDFGGCSVYLSSRSAGVLAGRMEQELYQGVTETS